MRVPANRSLPTVPKLRNSIGWLLIASSALKQVLSKRSITL
jgi:hypothetical protein